MFALDSLSRVFFVARGMFAAVGMAVVLVLSLPAPRGHLLSPSQLDPRFHLTS